jgi:hypothetical protein
MSEEMVPLIFEFKGFSFSDIFSTSKDEGAREFLPFPQPVFKARWLGQVDTGHWHQGEEVTSMHNSVRPFVQEA